MEKIIDGKLYDTDKAMLIASDRFWDGHNWERQGRNKFLYKTEKGNFFLHTTTLWQGEHDNITPLSIEEAKQFYERLPEHNLTYQEAFGIVPELA